MATATIPTSAPGVTKSVVSTAAIARARFVTFAGAQAGAGANALGVSALACDSGEMVPVVLTGTAIVEASAAISVGAAVKSAANGLAVTDGAPAIAVTLGYAMTAANANGDFLEVRLGA